MLVKDWMSEHVITLDENTSIMKAVQVMKEHKIRRIPVTRDGKLSGIVTDRDIKEVTPSKIATVEIHELYYLLSELKLKDIMTKDPITVFPDDTVEYAAVLMLENKISGLPVINREGYVVGIITQTDIFKLFVNITGIYYSPYQISLLINHPNELMELFQVFKDMGVSLYSLLTWKEETAFPIEHSEKDLRSEHKRLVFIRPEEISKEKFEALTEALKQKFKLFYAIKEDLAKLPHRKVEKEAEEVIF